MMPDVVLRIEPFERCCIMVVMWEAEGLWWPLWLSPRSSRRPPPPTVFARDDDLIISQFLLCPMLCLHTK